MSQWGFYIDMTICTGCKTCQIACKDKNNLEAGTLFRRVKSFEGGKFPKTWTYNISISCNHCDNPKCVKNCPTGAMHKGENGIVLPDKNKCIGCRMCTLSCPYSQPQYFKEEGKVSKCDFCIELINRKEDPACVAACPMRAIHYGPLDDLKSKYGEGHSKVRGLPDPSITRPSIIIHAKIESIKD